jgi:hypothetical protein
MEPWDRGSEPTNGTTENVLMFAGRPSTYIDAKAYLYTLKMEEENSIETSVNSYHISGASYLHRISDLNDWDCFFVFLILNLKVSLVKAVNNFSKQRERDRVKFRVVLSLTV